MTATMSVIMAEAAAMALAAKMVSLLHLQGTNFLTDNQLLVNFFNSQDHSSPSDWTIKRFTQQFLNHIAGLSCNIFKIPRDSNATAHMLARQVTSDNGSASQSPVISCYLTCKFHSGAHSVLAIVIEHSGTGPYRCTIPDFIIIIICE
jgi:hypothetical protein